MVKLIANIANDPMFYVAQIVGFIGLVFTLLSFQQRKREGVLRFQVLASVTFALQLFLLKALTGAYLDTVAFIRTFVFSKLNPEKKRTPLWLVFFLVVILVIGIVTYENFISIFSILGASLSTVALWMKKAKHIRIISLFVGPCWIIYSIYYGAYVSAINEVLAMTSITIGLIRHDLKKE